MLNFKAKLTVRHILVATTGTLILVAFLFPPFHEEIPPGGVRNAGYSFILLPPSSQWATIDTDFLLIELIGIILLAGILWILAGMMEADSYDSRSQADCESLIAKAEADKLALARKYEEGEISYVQLREQEIQLDRIIRTQSNSGMEKGASERTFKT